MRLRSGGGRELLCPFQGHSSAPVPHTLGVRRSYSLAFSCPAHSGQAPRVEVGSGWLGARAGEEPPPRRPPAPWEGLPAEPPAASGGSPGAWLRCRVRPFPLVQPRSCRGIWAAHAVSTEASAACCRVTVSGTQLAACPQGAGLVGSLGCVHTPCHLCEWGT